VSRASAAESIQVRPSRPEESLRIQEIERLAGARFRDVGLVRVADDEPPSVEDLARGCDDGRLFVAVGKGGVLVGYVLADELDHQAHIEQMSVVPSYQGRGVARLLLGQIRSWAMQRDRGAITLTTFSEVPWNRPLYEHLGFTVMAADEIGPELRWRRAVEADRGLDPAKRVCMRLDLAAGALARSGNDEALQ
jgi:GNAT superfamily N-acetyltransferase